MAKLTLGDLRKPYRHGEFPYNTRAERFLEMYKDHIPFKMTNGKEAIVLGDANPDSDFISKIERTAEGHIASLGNKDLVAIRYSDGSEDTVHLSAFEKTAENFGSSQGRSSADTTDLEETLTCKACDLAFREGRDLTVKDLGALGDEELPEAWKKSVIAIANILRKSELVKVQNPEFFHGGTGVLSQNTPAALVVACFKRVSAKENISLSKWNPADMWIISKDFNASILAEINSLKELNSWMLSHQDLVQGVSFKKVVSDPKVEIVEPEDCDKNIAQDFNIRWSGSSLMVYWNTEILHNISSIKFRCFGGDSGYQAELQGKNAQGGKIGLAAMNGAMNMVGITGCELPECRELRMQFTRQEGNYYEKLQSLIRERKPEEKYVKELGQKINFFLGCWLEETLKIAGKEKAEKFLTVLINFAASKSPKSCVHLKVS